MSLINKNIGLQTSDVYPCRSPLEMQPSYIVHVSYLGIWILCTAPELLETYVWSIQGEIETKDPGLY